MNPRAPFQAGIPFVSLLIPLDTGRSYMFRANLEPNKKVRDNWLSKLNSADQVVGATACPEKTPVEKIDRVLGQWKAVFSGRRGWNVDSQFPVSFSKPLGWNARLKLEPLEDSECRQIIESMTWVMPDTAELEFIFFPLGIGVLVFRACLVGNPVEALQNYRADRKRLKEVFAPLLVRGASAFNDVLGAAVRWPEDQKVVYELPHVGLWREAGIREARYPFPLVFTAVQDDYGVLRKEDLAQAGRHGDEEDHSYSDGRSGARVHIGWAEAYVCDASEEFSHAIETDFLIAMTSWYALVLMNRLASLYLVEAFADLTSRQPRIRRAESRTIRLTFMDAANASRPIRWTTRQRDLLLLERIHATWSSDHWWKSVKERTELLALHHEQLEAEESERRNAWLAFFGIAIACLTLASATADVLNLVSDSSRMLPFFKSYRLGVSLLVPTVAGFVLWIFWRRKGRG